MDFNLERSKAHALNNFDNFDDKIDEIEELKKQIEKLNAKNEKLEKKVVNEDIRYGLVGTKINYSWLWSSMIERYDGNNEYDFFKDLREPDSNQSISWEEYKICNELGNQISKRINWGQYQDIENDINDAISELAELYRNCCPRCIEEYEDEEGNLCKGERKESCCSGCGVCKDCECLYECEEN